MAAGVASVPLRPRNSARSPVNVRFDLAAVDERDAIGELRVIDIASKNGAAGRIELRS